MAINHDAFLASLGRAQQWSREGRVLEFRDPKSGNVIWRSNPGPQSDLMWRPEFEILIGGARGGGKSGGLMVWMISGNFDLPPDHPQFGTLVTHPKFSGIIFRKDATDLREFIDQATPFYEALGAKKVDDPPVFTWGKNGAKLYTNHLKDETAFEKYKGGNFCRLGIEEATQIAEYKAYLKALSVCRTPVPELRPAWSDAVGQVLLTTNPDGPGQWVKDRFVEVYDSNGKLIPWGKTMRDPATKLTRVFIPAKLKDNPYLGESYRSALLLQAEADPSLVAAWLEGEWGVTSSTFFKNFRPNGPREGEPAHANHVIDPVPLMPWWPRFIGMDWGFRDEAVALWGCHNHEDERIHVYREFVVSGMGSKELGAEIARRSLVDLAGLEQHIIPMWLSHECFSKGDVGKTKAEQIADGIREVIEAFGGTVVVADSSGKIENLNYGAMDDGQFRILLYPSTRMREDVWSYIRDLLRFQAIVQRGEPDQAYIDKLLQEPDGFNKVEKYVQSFRKGKPEPMPGILFWRECVRVIKQLKNALHDEKKVEDIYEGRQGNEHWDALSALRYLVAGMRVVREKLPKYAFMARRMESLPDEVKADPARMMFVQMKAEADWQKRRKPMEPFSLPRHSSMRVQ